MVRKGKGKEMGGESHQAKGRGDRIRLLKSKRLGGQGSNNNHNDYCEYLPNANHTFKEEQAEHKLSERMRGGAARQRNIREKKKSGGKALRRDPKCRSNILESALNL